MKYFFFSLLCPEKITENGLSLCIIFFLRASEDLTMYNPECVPVTGDSMKAAIDWLWELERTEPVSSTATCETVLKAMADRNVSYQEIKG